MILCYIFILMAVLAAFFFTIVAIDPFIREKDTKFSRWWKRTIIDEDPTDLN